MPHQRDAAAWNGRTPDPSKAPTSELRSDGQAGGLSHHNGTMNYISFAQPGPPEVLHLAEGPVPVPGPGEVLIRVEAAGVNRPDVLQRAGQYPPPPGASDRKSV